MAIEIDGIEGTEAALVRRYCEEAFAALGHTADLCVTVRGGVVSAIEALGLVRPTGPDGSAYDNGVWLNRRILFGPRARLRFILHEEVAHSVLARSGVPHDNRDTEEAFWQELFAGYVQVDALPPGNGGLDLTTKPVPPDSHLAEIGKHVGAALAGSAVNRQHIEDWSLAAGYLTTSADSLSADWTSRPPSP